MLNDSWHHLLSSIWWHLSNPISDKSFQCPENSAWANFPCSGTSTPSLPTPMKLHRRGPTRSSSFCQWRVSTVWAGGLARQGEAPAGVPWVHPRDPRGERRERTPARCPLTSRGESQCILTYSHTLSLHLSLSYKSKGFNFNLKFQ